MSDFCDFVPDDPSCAPVDPPTPGPDGDGGKGGDDHHGEVDDYGDMEDMKMMNPMMGNLTYLHVALMSAVHGGLELFVYHDDTEYDDGDVLTTNYWKYLAELHHYSHFGIMSILTVTQILSMVGVAGEINIMAWMYMEMVEAVIALVLHIGNMYVYELAYSYTQDSSNTSANITKAENVMAGIEDEMTESTIMETASHFALHVEHENWLYGQVKMLPEEA